QTSHGVIVVELYERQAPQAVENFLGYVRDGFYENTIVHQVVAGKFITAGVYTDDLATKPAGDPVANESNNGLSNLRGRVAVAELDEPGTGTSGFIIHLSDNIDRDFDLDSGERGL